MITSLILSFIGAIVMAMIFEALFYLFPYGVIGMTKYQSSICYWALIAFLGFCSGRGMFVAHLPAIAPVAIAHIQLSRDPRTRITLSLLLRQVGILASRSLATLKTWCRARFNHTP